MPLPLKHNLAYLFIISCQIILISCANNNQNKEKNTTIDVKTIAKTNLLKDCQELFKNAKRHDSILLTQTEINIAAANNAIKAFTDYAYICTNDSFAPFFLVKTALVAKSIKNAPQAKLVLDLCLKNYPTFKNRDAALFLLAQLYNEPSGLNNETEAKKLYQKIINEYPKSEWVQSAKGAIAFLGKSDEQIIQLLNKK